MKKINVEKLNEAVKKHAAEHIEKDHLFGTSCRVFQNGEMVYESCEGMANREKNIPLSLDSMFRLASMTKPITAIVALIFVECDQLSLSSNEKTTRYIKKGV